MKAEERDARYGAALGALVLSLAALYAPMFLGESLFDRDLSRWSLPARHFVRGAIERGDTPWWNPALGLGLAVGTEPLYGIFYPPNLLHQFGTVAWMITFVGWLHLAWGAAGAFLLARAFGARPLGSLVAGVAWSCGGPVVSMWTVSLLLPAGSWTPWIAIGMMHLASGVDPRPRAVALAALPVAMSLLLGELFLSFASLCFGAALGGLAIAHGPRAPQGPRRRVALARFALLAALASALGAVTASAALAPLALGAQDPLRRAPLSPESAYVASVHPARVIELAARSAFGNPEEAYSERPTIGEAKLGGRPIVESVYLGASALALALFALGRDRRVANRLAAVALFTLLLAMGRHTPLFPVVRAVLRPLSYMRHPEKLLLLMAPAFAVLAGLGADRVVAERAAPWKRAGALAAALVAVALTARLWLPAEAAAWMRRGCAAGAALAAVAWVLVHALRARPRALAVGLAALVAIDLWAAHVPLLDFAAASELTEHPLMARAIVADSRARSGIAPPRAHWCDEISRQLPPVLSIFTRSEAEAMVRESLIFNTSNVAGLGTLAGHNVAAPTGYFRAYREARARGLRSFGLFAADYVLAPIAGSVTLSAVTDGLESFATIHGVVRAFRQPAALPRVYLTYATEALDPRAVPRRLFDPPVLTGAVALVAPDVRLALGPVDPRGACALTRYRNGSLEATCTTAAPALAVFVEQFAPGWTATVDGAPAPIVRANHFMRGVALPRGTHRVAMTYAAPGVRLGAALSLAGALAIALCVARYRRTASSE